MYIASLACSGHHQRFSTTLRQDHTTSCECALGKHSYFGTSVRVHLSSHHWAAYSVSHRLVAFNSAYSEKKLSIANHWLTYIGYNHSKATEDQTDRNLSCNQLICMVDLVFTTTSFFPNSNWGSVKYRQCVNAGHLLQHPSAMGKFTLIM